MIETKRLKMAIDFILFIFLLYSGTHPLNLIRLLRREFTGTLIRTAVHRSEVIDK